jgi:hypothetical protein
MALASMKVAFEDDNPLCSLMADRRTGRFKQEVLGERVLSVIIEFKIENKKLHEVLPAIREVADRIDTVFSLGLISRVESDGGIPVTPLARAAGFSVRPNMKVNVGLGRALRQEG